MCIQGMNTGNFISNYTTPNHTRPSNIFTNWSNVLLSESFILLLRHVLISITTIQVYLCLIVKYIYIQALKFFLKIRTSSFCFLLICVFCFWLHICNINLHILGKWSSQIFITNSLSFVHRMKNVGFIPAVTFFSWPERIPNNYSVLCFFMMYPTLEHGFPTSLAMSQYLLPSARNLKLKWAVAMLFNSLCSACYFFMPDTAWIASIHHAECFCTQ